SWSDMGLAGPRLALPGSSPRSLGRDDRPHYSRLLSLVDDVAGDTEAVNADRHAAIGRDLGEHRPDLVGGEPVAQRAAGVGLEFLHLTEGRDHAEVEDRALARGERRVAPGLAPAVLGDQPLEVAIEVVDAFERAVDISVAQHLAAHGHALVV